MVIRGATPPALAPDQSWEHRFTTPGVYPHFDPFASRRKGKIVVTLPPLTSLRGPLFGKKQSPSLPEEIASHTPLAMTLEEIASGHPSTAPAEHQQAPLRTPLAMTVEIAITDAGFDPPEVTIAAGDTVRWTNRGSGLHAVAGGAPARTYLPVVLRR